MFPFAVIKTIIFQMQEKKIKQNNIPVLLNNTQYHWY